MPNTYLGANGSATTTANITDFWFLGGTLVRSATETNRQVLFRSAGVLSNLYVRTTANGITGTSTVSTRKNAGAGGQSISMGTGTTGEYTDVSGTDTVAAGDKFNYTFVPGAATGTVTFSVQSCIFEATTDTVSRLITTHTGTLATASTTWFLALGGDFGAAVTTETNAKSRMRKAGTLTNACARVTSARATATTVKSNKNGSPGNLSVSCTAGATGFFEDVVNSDTISAGEDWDWSITTGTGVDNLVIQYVAGDFVSTAQIGVVEVSHMTPVVFADNTTRYSPIYGKLFNTTTESDTKADCRIAGVYSELTALVTQNDMGVGITSTITLRKNGADTALVCSLTGNTTGVFSDSSHTVTLVSTDEVNYSITAPSVSGAHTVTIANILMYIEGIKRISLSRSYLYNVLGRISLSRIYKYNLIGRISLSRIYKYHLLGRISLSRIYKYHLLGRISLSRIYKYNLLGRISLSRLYKYHVQARVSLSRIYKYHLTNLVSLSRTYKYHILGRVSLSQIYKYNLIARVSRSCSYLWNVIGRISLSRIYKYHVVGRVSLSSMLKYNILERISLSRTYLWDIVESALERISKPQTYKWNVNARVSLSRIYKYNILGRVSLSRNYLYHVLGRISLSRIYKYHLLGRISLSRIYKYHLLARVSLSSILKYNMNARISLSRVYKYNLIGRISKAQTYLWNVIFGGLERISKSNTYKWDLLGRVSLSRTYKHHILNKVSLSRVYKYHIISRISLSRIYKYHLIGRISLARTYKFDLLNHVSLSRNYLWHVTTLVSKSSIFKYNVLKRISLSRIFRWDFERIPTTRGRTLAGNLESKQRYPKQFDRIRSYFYRPQPTKGRRNSKYTRG